MNPWLAILLGILTWLIVGFIVSLVWFTNELRKGER